MPRETIMSQLECIVRWYFQTVYGKEEGGTVSPWYCDFTKAGHMAVDPRRLSREPSADTLFKLFITMTMFQGYRDVVISQRQRSLTVAQAQNLISRPLLARSIAAHPCEDLLDAETFPSRCNVRLTAGRIDCLRHPKQPCPVKQASEQYHRMGDMGKLPISALLYHQQAGLFGKQLKGYISIGDQRRRAPLALASIRKVYRVGPKLANMWLSALSTPSLAPGLTPLYPAINGEQLVVIDTNVSQAIQLLTRTTVSTSYQSLTRWLHRHAKPIDLTDFAAELPSYSPRMLQQTLYWFRSRSNRLAIGDPCSREPGDCRRCAPRLCPFGRS